MSRFLAGQLLLNTVETLLAVLGGYFIMKKEDMLDISRNTEVKDRIRKIPEALNILFSEVEKDVNRLIKNTENRQRSAAVPSGAAANNARNKNAEPWIPPIITFCKVKNLRWC